VSGRSVMVSNGRHRTLFRSRRYGRLQNVPADNLQPLERRKVLVQ
jgi:hypothetical protein